MGRIFTGSDAHAASRGLMGTVVIPEGVIEIEPCAFAGMDDLIAVVLPSSLGRIGRGAFKDCRSLRQVRFGDNVRTIGGGAFQGCSGISELLIPGSVKSIGDMAFMGCAGLRKLLLCPVPGKVALGRRLFLECPPDLSISWKEPSALRRRIPCPVCIRRWAFPALSACSPFPAERRNHGGAATHGAL